LRRATASAEIAEDLSEHYRRDRWAFSTPLCDVYDGHDLRLERDVQLRFFTPRVVRDPSTAAAVLAAAREAAALVHPNLVAVYDIGTIGGRRCVVTEATVARLADRAGSLSADDAMALARDCVEGLRVAHAAGLVHGNIADAIAFGPDGTAKIADVGLFPATAAPNTVTPEGDFRALATVLRRLGADDAAAWVDSEISGTQPLTTTPILPVAPVAPVAPVDPSPTPTATIPTRPDPEPEVDSEPEPERERAARADARGARRQFPTWVLPYAAAVALVAGLLAVAFTDDDAPEIPGLRTDAPAHHTGLPPQIPQ
jgi:serine/threonine-protein kinase